MSNFSRRWGLPLYRHQIEKRASRGRRPGHTGSCRIRLEGWIRNVAARAPIWGDVDIEAFCAITGYSREHTMRQLSKIRRERDDLAFETKIRQKRGRKRWGVIVAERAKLLFDRRSLFYDREGRRLHNYTTLGKDGEKITPTSSARAQTPRPRGRPMQKRIPNMNENSQPGLSNPSSRRGPDMPLGGKRASNSNRLRFREVSFKNGGVCDNAIIKKDSIGIQQHEVYGAPRNIVPMHANKAEQARRRGPKALRRKAFALMEEVFREHWDTCKVRFSRPAAFRYALRALEEGHEASRILSCYSRALFVCHGLAVDRAASAGKIIFFNPSSTIVKARHLLARDGLNARERIALWYQNHSRSAPSFENSSDSFDAEELRKKIAASLGCDLPDSLSHYQR